MNKRINVYKSRQNGTGADIDRREYEGTVCLRRMIFQIRDDKEKWKWIRGELVEGDRGKRTLLPTTTSTATHYILCTETLEKPMS